MTRPISLLLSLAATVVLTVAPFLIARRMTPAVHAILPFLLIGILAGFVHGMGYVPRQRFIGALANPLFAWPVMAGALLLLIVQ
jgi:predicted membrane protein